MFEDDEMVLVIDILGSEFKMPYSEAKNFPFKARIEELIVGDREFESRRTDQIKEENCEK